MRRSSVAVAASLALAVVSAAVSFAVERNIMMPLVPADQLASAKALTSPLSASPEVVAKGKVLYEGKGACVNCHGASGRGDGVAAANLDPSPRNFRHHGFWRHRTEGEVFWVIKNGAAGTAMIPFGGVLTDEEIWTVIQYERSFAGGHGSMGGMGPGGMGPRGGECCAGQEGMP